MSTQFVEMYHPNIPSTAVTPALVAIQAVDEQYARGWLLVDPAAPPPVVNTPYYTREASDSRYVRDWAGAETVTAGAIRMAPDGHVIARTADGTTRSSYDATEQAAWTAVGGQTAAQLAADPALRAAFGALPKVAATVTASGALVANKHNPVDATSGAKTMTLPTGQPEGTQVSVEKTDASLNAVSVTGNVRGVAGTTVNLVWQNEDLIFRVDSSGSWWTIAGHKTKTTLDANLRSMVPVTKFGQVGTDDDSAAFIAAAASGGLIYVPPGTYRIQGVQVGTGTVFHMGPGVTFRRPVGYTGSSGVTFRLGNTDTNSVTHATHLGLVGGPWTIDNAGYSNGHSIQVFDAKRWRIENLTLLNSIAAPAITLAKNTAGTMPENGSVTNIRSIGGAVGAVWLTCGRRLEFRQLASDDFCPLVVELDFGDYQNSVVEDVIADGLWLERPATAHSINMECGVKFSVPASCRVSRVSVRGVRALNADGVQLTWRLPYGAGTIEDVTIEDVVADCNNIGHFGVTVDQIDPVRVVIRRLRTTGALSQGAALRGDITLYDVVAENSAGVGFFDTGASIVPGRVRRFYNCKAINNTGSGFYSGTAERYELYGCVATDARGASATQNQGVNVADGGTALIVGGNMSPNKLRRVYWNPGAAGTVVREVDSLDADTNGSVQSAPPTTGVHAKGEIVWNSNAATGGGTQGWVCTAAGEPGTWTRLDALGPELLASGEATFEDRTQGTSSSVAAGASGSVRFTYFTAKKTESITQLRLYSATTAAAATPTLVRAGVYSVAANGDLTLVAAIANDTGIYAAASTAYLRTLTTTLNKVAGQRYAVGELVVSAAALPTRVGVTSGSSAALALAPRRAASLASQTDLPASVPSASLSATASVLYIELVP